MVIVKNNIQTLYLFYIIRCHERLNKVLVNKKYSRDAFLNLSLSILKISYVSIQYLIIRQ